MTQIAVVLSMNKLEGNEYRNSNIIHSNINLILNQFQSELESPIFLVSTNPHKNIVLSGKYEFLMGFSEDLKKCMFSNE